MNPLSVGTYPDGNFSNKSVPCCKPFSSAMGTPKIHDFQIFTQSSVYTYIYIWEFPKIRGTLLGVPIMRIIVYWGLYWGPPNFGKLPYIYIYIERERERPARRIIPHMCVCVCACAYAYKCIYVYMYEQ